MASSSKRTVDTHSEIGGKIRSARRTSVLRKASGYCSSGTCSASSSEESLGQESVDKHICERRGDLLEPCPILGRPDRKVLKEEIRDNVIIRTTETASHVLVMGSPCIFLHPLCCPYADGTRCGSFRAHAPQYLREHMESVHSLHNVQINLACPCPAECNIVNGQPRHCDDVKYDPMDGVLETHISQQHSMYFDKIQTALCYRGDKDLDDIPAEDIDYIKFLDTGKKLPYWTLDSTQLFPSQRLPEKVTFLDVVKNKKICHICSVPPCSGKDALDHWTFCMHLEVHRVAFGTQVRYYERCPECDLTIRRKFGKMMLHVRAMHPELLDAPVHFSDLAEAELKKLEQQIKRVIVGQAIGDTANAAGADGTKAHYLYNYFCPVQGCRECYSEQDEIVWHLRADHQKEWNTAGNN